MRRNAVAILHYAGPPYVGGVEITMAAHARELAREGRRVSIISGRGDSAAGWMSPELAERARLSLTAHPLLGSRGEELEGLARELAAGVVSARFYELVDQLAAWLGRQFEREGIEALIVHNVLSLHKNLAFTAALHKLHERGHLPHTLAWCHDFAWLDPLYRPELHPSWPWDLLRTPWPGVRYVVVSDDRRAMLASLLGIPAAEVTVVTPGVDVEGFLKLEPATAELARRLGLAAADPLLILPARITRRKNIELAIAVVGALRAAGLAPRLVVTGPPGPHNPANAAYLAELQALRDASGAGDAVIFLYERHLDAAGAPLPVSDAMVADLYRLADGLLFPSRYEGFGIPVLEAGLAGLPLFLSDIPPFRETAADAAVFFGLDEPPAAIAARLAAALRADGRAALRRRVRAGFSWEAIVRRAVAPLIDAEAEG